jgi:hypothetical protein
MIVVLSSVLSYQKAVVALKMMAVVSVHEFMLFLRYFPMRARAMMALLQQIVLLLRSTAA